MKQSWKYFVGASILAGALALKAGAPIVPIAAGVLIAASLTWKMSARRSNDAPR